MFESLCYAQMPPEICLGWFALKARGRSQDGCASTCACGVDLSSGIEPGIRSLSTAKLRTTLPFRVRLSKGTTVHRIPTLQRWGRAGGVKKAKQNKTKRKKKKTPSCHFTFISLSILFIHMMLFLKNRKGATGNNSPVRSGLGVWLDEWLGWSWWGHGNKTMGLDAHFPQSCPAREQEGAAGRRCTCGLPFGA